VFAPGAAEESPLAGSFEPRLENMLVEEHRIQGSVALSRKQFDEWRNVQIAGNLTVHAPAPPSTTRENF